MGYPENSMALFDRLRTSQRLAFLVASLAVPSVLLLAAPATPPWIAGGVLAGALVLATVLALGLLRPVSTAVAGLDASAGELAALVNVRKALDSAAVSLMVADAEHRITYLNEALVAMFRDSEADIRKELPNFRASELVGSSIDLFHKDPSHQRGMVGAMRETFNGTIRVGGRTFKIIASPIHQADVRTGTVVQWIDHTAAVAREATESAQRAAEEARTAENARLRQALEKVSSSVMVADADGIITYMNESTRELFRRQESNLRKALPNFSMDRILGHSFDQFHRNPGHQRNMLGTLTGVHRTEFTIGGITLWISGAPVFGPDGRRLGTVVEWRDRTEEVATESEINQVVEGALEGDLTRRVPVQGKTGFFATLAGGLNRLLDAMSDVVRVVGESAQEVSTGAGDIARGNQDLSQRTETVASSLQETASSMEEMTSTVKANADNAHQADTLASTARRQAERGGIVVDQAVAAMQQISESSRKIEAIIGVIDEIAFQTNLLALNAAVEAARAGDQGRGFAVVASEVRNLAGRSAEAAREIKGLINDSVGKVEEGSRLVDESGSTLSEINGAVRKVADIIAEIAQASREQSSGIEQVNRAVMQLDQMTQQDAAMVEQAAAASESLTERAAELTQLMQKYRTVGGPGAARPAARAQRPAPVGRVA
jgi:methyl-accepting chemotaxis protein